MLTQVGAQVYKLHIYWKGVGVWQKTGTLAKFREKTGTSTLIQQNLACFTYIFVYFDIFTDILIKSYWA